jgi:adenylylsulfate kinase-like enzyme
LWVEKKAVSYGTTAINIPAFTGNSYQYDPSKETYIRLRADTLFSNENSTQITNVVYDLLLLRN